MIVGRLFDQPPTLPLWDDRTAIRAELFSVERLEEHARSLAAAQPARPGRAKGQPLGGRVLDNAAFLLAAHRAIVDAAASKRQITPAAEWLIDNYHLVDMQVREIGIDLPAGYYWQLPKLAEGPFAGLPRVFGLAWSFVAHTDSHFEPVALHRYLDAYQEVQPLTIGELWAVPITLRIVLIENLRRLAALIVANDAARRDADALADQILTSQAGPTPNQPDAFAAIGPDPLQSAFAVQLAHRFRGHDLHDETAQGWLDRRLATENTSVDLVVQDEMQRQGASNATIRNIITSLRAIAGNDWTEAFELISLVDRVLDTGDGFQDMDFASRNLYRTAVEQIARFSHRSELDVAREAVAAAAAQPPDDQRPNDRARDPGYYLLAAGRRRFEGAMGFRPPLQTRLGRACRAVGISFYAGAVLGVAAAFIALALVLLAAAGPIGWPLAIFAIVGIVPASDAAVACVNRALMWAFGATSLPGLALRQGIPPELRTLVAVPTMLTSLEVIAQQVAQLEVHHLSSPDGEVHFALLSDWTDAPAEHADTDAALLQAATDGIAKLNLHHGPAPGGDRFLLLHRRRVWNPGEQRWIGWERKRGKLHELNRALRGKTDTSFLETAQPLPTGVRYVVTLDADTRLPRDALRRMVGKMAHPLNRPLFDAKSSRVVQGYSVLQPRVTPSLPVGKDSSLFQRVFSSMDGIDPYAGAISDVYQDLFGEGSYAGKGIYDVDAFETALAGRVPDSALLSHDLFEGVFARAGLVSDIEVVEEFPPAYAVAAMRQHRWARGDWQLLPWIAPLLHPASAKPSTALPPIGRWKMLDNLRRTLSAPACVIALLAGWTLPFQPALLWTALVLATLALPAILPVIGDLAPGRRWITLRNYLVVLGDGLAHAATLFTLNLTFVAHQACLMADAILRTLGRVFVTRRNLLQWVTAAQAGESPQLGLQGIYRQMIGAPVLAALAMSVALASHHGAWPIALPIALLWILSPAIALRASERSDIARRFRASEPDLRALRITARRTWRFFETFVTPTENALPPDNFQEDPAPVIAHRTSPTNIGLYLLSTVSAHDFGWIGRAETVERLEATLATMSKMERFRGHFYNWYDTQDLRPLEPKYVSTVDSGNLAGHLIALASACRDWRERPGPAPRTAGLQDAWRLAEAAAAQLPQARLAPLQDALAVVQTIILEPGNPARASRMPAEIRITADLARALPPPIETTDLVFWIEAVGRTAASHRRDLDPTHELPARIEAIERTAHAMALAMQFGFLRNDTRKLLSIGYAVAEDVIDPNCYDLLASEARLAAFVAIAKGDVPAREWFRLGRAMTPASSGAALVSWSGSMFEYLMPSLVMRAPSGSLLENTNELVVQRQIDAGTTKNIPWGVSESAYNVRDVEYTYQYSNFGIPSLGLRRGLEDDTVIAPYATALAAMVDPKRAVQNLQRLASIGAEGRYGFYEALDYTETRVPENQAFAIVRAFMAHHQGMTIVALADATLDGIMRERFHADPIIKATELLLQERAPRDMPIARPLPTKNKRGSATPASIPPGGRRFASAQTLAPATHLLSNGRYAVMLTAAGSGYSRWHDLDVTRWREDGTLDDWGAYIYLRDVRSGRTWSAGLQPTGVEPDEYDVCFKEDRAEFARRDGAITTIMDVLVSPEHDAEIRRISVANAGPAAREIEITSFAEIALAASAADIAHPAFAKIFVETEYLPEYRAIVATRRRRTPTEPEIWAAHLAVVEGQASIQFETDRARIIGRGHGVRDPVCLATPLTGSVGRVLDAAFALRCRVTIPAGGMIHIAFWTAVAPSRDLLLGIVDKHRDASAFDRASTLAWTQAQVQMRHLGISPGQADLFQTLAGHMRFASPALRAPAPAILQGAGPQSGLWGQGISGDLPILLLRIGSGDDLDLARELLLAHEYMRLKRLAVDLVILNEHAASYSQDLQGALEALVRAQPRATVPGRGAIFLLRADLVAPQTCALLASAARVVLRAKAGGLTEQLERLKTEPAPTRRTTRPPGRPGIDALPIPALECANGIGGFANDGHDYVVVLKPGQSTPAPWINVIANPGFGFQVAAEGSGFTWAGNSRENQLTPWSNDPVTDRPGECIYLRDETTLDIWSPTASPRRDPAATYVATHGHGYSRFDRTAFGITTHLLQYVPTDDPIKISRLQLHNPSTRTRTISVTAYAEWVLGPSRTATSAFVTTEIDPTTNAMFARNAWAVAADQRTAFADLAGRQTTWTADRRHFIGRNGTLARPAGMTDPAPLDGKIGAGLDPCATLRTLVELPPGAHAEIVFLLGEGTTAEHARRLVTDYRDADLDAVLATVRHRWDDLLGAVTVQTPDRSMDIMLNGWLLYQTLSSRVWARAGFYQASGAYGFRDQLQDGMALTAAAPGLARAHLLRAAARQFDEGDVQHWWLPETGRGVRTRISDDCAWLAYTVAHYVDATGETAILDETIPFLSAPILAADEHDRFFLPETSDHAASLFDHCARALDRSLPTGAHGLPLMGTGDWNDGMSRVGEAGTGESVWLGWFLHAALTAFVPLARARNDTAHVQAWQTHAAALATALDQAWDGDWYLRAYFDDGTKLGTHTDAECRIDSIAQSWAVLSGAARPGRAAQAMAAVDRELILDTEGLALLFKAPFDQTTADPGYIKGYPPGIRENGGQYTHAALWSVMAFAALGQGAKAAHLFAMLNPINHARTAAEIARYKVEPYAVVADVYAVPPHVGRGGWSWYTGSAGWMQRAGIESILGIRIRGANLHIAPCIPPEWPHYRVTIKWRTATYVIAVDNQAQRGGGVRTLTLDGTPAHLPLPLADDGATHHVAVTLGDQNPAHTS